MTASTEIVRFGLLVTATVVGAWSARAIPRLLLFFIANLLYELVTEIPLVIGGDQSRAYAITYAVCTTIWLVMAVGIAIHSLCHHPYPRRRFGVSIMFAIVLGRMVEVGLHHPPSFTDWILLIQGGVLFACGQSIGDAAFYARRYAHDCVQVILAILWLLQAAFFWGYLLSLPEVLAIAIGWWVPTALCVIGFLLIAFCLKREEVMRRHTIRAK